MNRKERRAKRAEERRTHAANVVRPGLFVVDEATGLKTAFAGTSGSRTVTVVSRPQGGPAYIVVDASEAKLWADVLDHNGVWRDVTTVQGGIAGSPWSPTSEVETRINLPFCLALALVELARREAFEPIMLAALLQTWPEPALATMLDLGGHEKLFRVVREWLAETFPHLADVERMRTAALLAYRPEYVPALPPAPRGSCWTFGLRDDVRPVIE